MGRHEVLVGRVLALPPADRLRLLRTLPAAELAGWERDWREWAHHGQLEPEGDWRAWVMMAGRGFGKTRAGAQWVHAQATAVPRARIALVAATADEARAVMVEGSSGLLTLPIHPAERPVFAASLRTLTWPNHSMAFLYSGAKPDGLRGPQHHLAWCDELAKWRHPGETWDMLQLGLRMGEAPRALVTTTPRGGLAALSGLLRDAGTVVTGGATWRNPHLPDAFIGAVVARFAGTRRGREELEGLLDADVAGSLWPAALIAASRGSAPDTDALARVVIGVDPPASAGGTCGIVACALGRDGRFYVLADHSAAGLSPDGWARRVAGAAEAHGADRVVAETNQGGDMVAAVLRAADRAMPVTGVNATRGKAARAEPVAALFEQGRVTLAGRFAALEAELGGLTAAGGYAGPGRSPDRADAMVWALWALMITGREPRVAAM